MKNYFVTCKYFQLILQPLQTVICIYIYIYIIYICCIYMLYIYVIYICYIYTCIYIFTPSVVNTICIRSFRYTQVITSRKFQLKETWKLTKAIAEMKLDTEQMMKLEWLYKVGSECELNSWPDSSVS